MPRRSPPTNRVIRVLEYLAEHPRDAFTVSQIAERLRIVPSTCLGILTELAADAYVTRVQGTKRYRLGPAVLALGRAAQEGFGVIELVRGDLERITAKSGFPCTVSTVAEDLIVVLDRVGPVGRFDQFVQAGQEYPYAPPSGVVFAVWMSDEELEEWLSSYPPVPVDRDRLFELAESSRRLGFIVERFSDTSARSLTLLARLVEHEDDPDMRRAFEEIISIFPDRYYLDSELEANDLLPVTLVCAPVYGPTAHPDFLLGVLVFATITTGQLLEIAEELRMAGLRVTEQLGGKDPWAEYRKIRDEVETTRGEKKKGDDQACRCLSSSASLPSSATTGGVGDQPMRSAR